MSAEDELAQKVAAALFSKEGPSGLFDVKVLDVKASYARVSMAVTAAMLNGHGTIHGGLIFTLADTAFAYVCNGANETAVAQQASISFLSPALEGDVLIAEARERAVEGRTGVSEVVVTRSDGRTVAIFQGLSRRLGRPVLHPEPGA